MGSTRERESKKERERDVTCAMIILQDRKILFFAHIHIPTHTQVPRLFVAVCVCVDKLFNSGSYRFFPKCFVCFFFFLFFLLNTVFYRHERLKELEKLFLLPEPVRGYHFYHIHPA